MNQAQTNPRKYNLTIIILIAGVIVVSSIFYTYKKIHFTQSRNQNSTSTPRPDSSSMSGRLCSDLECSTHNSMSSVTIHTTVEKSADTSTEHTCHQVTEATIPSSDKQKQYHATCDKQSFPISYNFIRVARPSRSLPFSEPSFIKCSKDGGVDDKAPPQTGTPLSPSCVGQASLITVKYNTSIAVSDDEKQIDANSFAGNDVVAGPITSMTPSVEGLKANGKIVDSKAELFKPETDTSLRSCSGASPVNVEAVQVNQVALYVRKEDVGMNIAGSRNRYPLPTTDNAPRFGLADSSAHIETFYAYKRIVMQMTHNIHNRFMEFRNLCRRKGWELPIPLGPRNYQSMKRYMCNVTGESRSTMVHTHSMYCLDIRDPGLECIYNIYLTWSCVLNTFYTIICQASSKYVNTYNEVIYDFERSNVIDHDWEITAESISAMNQKFDELIDIFINEYCSNRELSNIMTLNHGLKLLIANKIVKYIDWLKVNATDTNMFDYDDVRNIVELIEQTQRVYAAKYGRCIVLALPVTAWTETLIQCLESL